jgi:leucyl aminopeptidase
MEDTKTNAVVVLFNSAEYHALNEKLDGQLGYATRNFKNADTDAEISYPMIDDIEFITVVKTPAANAHEWREFGGKYFGKYDGRVDTVKFNITDTGYNEAIAEGANLAGYRFTKYKTKKTETKVTAIEIPLTDDPYTGIDDSVKFARDLVSEPGNVLFPAEYARRIREHLVGRGVEVKIYHESQLKDMGLNLLLSVGQGSSKDSYVVVMEWMNGADDADVVALVGKGVTFDTGGISIKPSAGMGDMKYDMGGSAAVVGAMHAISGMDLEVNVVGIVGLVENMPDGNAIKPGDVVTSMSGLTVENLNTDAEGRLVLADLLTLVQRDYDPSVIIDLATLTGAILVSLGNEMAGLFSNSTLLSDDIIDAGAEAGEGYWRMPMGKNWNKMIDSQIADVKNISSGRGGGSTTAAEFLYRFVDSHRAWAHLDIAGMAWEEKGKATVPAGAVGFGVRTLYEFVLAQSLEQTEYDTDEDMKY